MGGSRRFDRQTGALMDLLTVVFFIVGVAALVVGAEALVRGASRLAARTGLSPVVIGLTVVAFGTSAPELAVSLGAAFRDEADLAVGNVVGSNIANIVLVLGIAAAVGGGLVVARRIVRIDVPIVIALSVLLLVFARDNELERWEGIVFVVLLISYIAWTIMSPGGTGDAASDDLPDLSSETLAATSAWTDLGAVLLGLALLVVGATALVEAATDIASALGVSELVIGLTVVAIGTSLPEVATSIVAVMRGERDLAVGNAIGSNLFNILAVLGVTAAVSPDSIPVPDVAVNVDLPVMIGVAVACLPIFWTGYLINRWEGIYFLGVYAAYIVWLILDSGEYSARDPYATIMLAVALPITVVVFVGAAIMERRRSDTSSTVSV